MRAHQPSTRPALKAASFPLILALILLCGSACSLIQPPQFLGVEGIEVDTVAVDSTVLTVRVALHNPNRAGAALTRAEYQIRIDDQLAGEGVWTGSLDVPGRDSIHLALPLVLRDQALPVWERAVLGADTVRLTAPVQVSLSTWLGGLDRNFLIDLDLPLKAMVQDWAREQVRRAGIVVERVTVRRLGVGEQELDVQVGLLNPFDFALQVETLELDVFINGTKAGRATTPAGIQLEPLQRSTVDLTLRTSSLPLGTSVLSGVLRGGWTWSVQGDADIVFRELTLQVPIEGEGRLAGF